MIKEIIKECIMDELQPTNRGGITAEGTTSKKSIVILQRGWIVVGDLTFTDTEGIINNASVIRTWGTSKGIGQLAIDGPQANTKLDECGTVRFNKGAEVCRMDCNVAKWS